MSNRAVESDVGRLEPGVFNMVESCAVLLSAAAGAETKDAAAELAAKATKALTAALESADVVAAFGDVFSHPQMIAGRIESRTVKDLQQAASEVFKVVDALRDQHQAADLQKVLGSLQRMGGPTPWDTFFATPGDAQRALMPLYSSRNAHPLGIGPIDGPGQRTSAGGQGLFYPVGGYDRFEQASAVVVAQNLADGLAIDSALGGDEDWAVIVASAPDGVLDVCGNVTDCLVNRRALAQTAGEANLVSVVAALSQGEGAESPDVLELIQEAPGLGVGVVRPRGGAANVTAGWSILEPDAIATMIEEARRESALKLDKVVDEDDRLDFGDGFRESVRDLREAAREVEPARAVNAPKVEKDLALSADLGL